MNPEFDDLDEILDEEAEVEEANRVEEDPDAEVDNEDVVEERVIPRDEEEDDEEGEDLFGDNYEKDYLLSRKDDHYDMEDLDQEDYAPMSLDQRLAAEEALKKRDLLRRKQREEDQDELETMIPQRDAIQDRLKASQAILKLLEEDDQVASKSWNNFNEQDNIDDSEESDAEDDEEEELMDPSALKIPMREFVTLEKTRNIIAKRFLKLLKTFQLPHEENAYYPDKIKEMVKRNKQSLVVEFSHITSTDPTLSIYLAEEPSEILKIFNEVAYAFMIKLQPNYVHIVPEVFVRVNGIPMEERIRDLRRNLLNTLIKVSGVVTRRTAVYPQLKVLHFECSSCGGLIGPIVINNDVGSGGFLNKPQNCPNCNQTKVSFSISQSHTIYRNYQKISLQETPGTVPPGRIPRSKDVILLNDLIDIVRPGEEVMVTGIYRHSYDMSLNAKQGFPIFATVLEANHISLKKSASSNSSLQLTESEKKYLLSVQHQMKDVIIKSIAPSIYGHEDIKLAIALALFGGESKKIEGKAHSIRGDVNLLMVGDPGTAKSQFLKYVEKTAQRAVFTTGKGSTAVGLTAAVRKDPVSKEWTLEGGALVLADNGTCLIDEFDKMNDQDRTSIHEAMEQQTISISKAGIVTTLQAKCSVMAAANPVKGRYDSSKTFHENVDLTDPIISRFDILCIVKDTVNPVIDEQLASFVVSSHIQSHPEQRQKNMSYNPITKLSEYDNEEECKKMGRLTQQLLRKMIIYAREKVRPKLINVDMERVTNFYKELRRESIHSGGIPVSVRHLESLIRMAEASARMHLRESVTEKDLDIAISVMLESFIQTQKFSVSNALRNRFRKFILSDTQEYQFLLNCLKNCFQEMAQVEEDEDGEESIFVEYAEFLNRAKEYNIYNVKNFLKSEFLQQQNYDYDEEAKRIYKLQ